ncbi:hypothetical protein [Actinomadura yumaensis]|uniref:Uncharacterized protein n=1 Tax=Actinomadura yumaensis TaxID=111807 RepID=A0ABW2CR63_9ACTN
MSVTFAAFDPVTYDILTPVEAQPNFSATNTMRLSEAIGLGQYGDEWGGSCTVEEMRACLLTWPDGHPDPGLNRRLGELVRLVDEASRLDRPGLLISWG